MSAVRACGCWSAVVRLGLAPRWHQFSRVIGAYPLIVYQHRAEFPLFLKWVFRLVPSWCQRPAVRAWAEFEYLAEQVYAASRAGSVINAKGEGKRLLDDYRKLRLAQAVFSRETVEP